MLWMSVEGLHVDLTVRGQLLAHSPLPRAVYEVSIQGVSVAQVYLQEARVNTSSGQRVVSVEYGLEAVGLDTRLLQIAGRSDLDLTLEIVKGGHAQGGPFRMTVESVWKYVTLSGLAAQANGPGYGRPVLYVGGVQVAGLELYEPKLVDGMASCIVTSPNDLDVLVAVALQHGRECDIRIEA